jgi:hypothetical protein
MNAIPDAVGDRLEGWKEQSKHLTGTRENGKEWKKVNEYGKRVDKDRACAPK